jgi:type I restriction enzyme, R subunit
MNEAETRAELIDPALREAGWGVVEGSRIRREVIALGRLIGGGRRKKKDIADYVLMYQGQKLAVVEAKKVSEPVTEGLGQAKRYAERLQTRFAYSTNGIGIYRVDMDAGTEEDVDDYLSPQDMWDQVFPQESNWRNSFSAIPFEDRGGTWQPRYYQHNAVEKTLENISAGESRILLTLATGTGKTAIAFQIAWKLFQSRWNLSGEPTRRPRILFLADRNILADQAFNAFAGFPDGAVVRVSPESIRHAGQVPTNASVFITIFQTFMSGTDDEGLPAPYFGEYPEDFFDFIVVDECHRGGANDESTWRDILEYFSSAVQLGLTATPKRNVNVDTYRYFGDPVYIYSLVEGINDGYLTPFKLREFATQLDDYTYNPEDTVVAGEIEEGRTYTEAEFNRKIIMPEREEGRVQIFMSEINQNEKTLVFCASQKHALMVRDFINQHKTSTDPNYCVRVAADDGEDGERWLRVFQDNENTIPTILTTSQKLSTGVDALNIRNIVLMRPINSMIEFKQIIGRGTRLFDGKDYFTVYDFVKAHERFEDPGWDGPPIEPEPCKRCGEIPCACERTPPEPCPNCGERPCVCEVTPECPECGLYPCVCEKKEKIEVRLADGKARTIQYMAATAFYDPAGNVISAAQFLERLYGELPRLFKDEDQLREIWSKPDTRKRLLTGLEEAGFGQDQLDEIRRLVDAVDSDLYDVLAYIRFAAEPITREQRVIDREEKINEGYNNKQREFLSFVLGHYVEQGVGELDDEKLPDLLELKYNTVRTAVNEIGQVEEIRDMFIGFQERLYR